MSSSPSPSPSPSPSASPSPSPSASGSPSPSPSTAPGSDDIDIEGVAEEDQVTVGGLVVRRHEDNDAPRKKITLKTTKTTGNVTLTCSNAKVKVFTAASEGTEITFDGTDNKFAVADLPKDLYVQGHEASDSMRDVTVTLTHDDDDSDSVKFTVRWVTMSTKHQGAVSEDNAAKVVIKATAVPWSDTLGYHLYQTGVIHFIAPDIDQFAHHGIATEIAGTVNPTNFVPGEFGGKMRLYRDIVNGKRWEGMAGDGTDAQTEIPSGPDFMEGLALHDFDPQSDES